MQKNIKEYSADMLREPCYVIFFSAENKGVKTCELEFVKIIDSKSSVIVKGYLQKRTGNLFTESAQLVKTDKIWLASVSNEAFNHYVKINNIRDVVKDVKINKGIFDGIVKQFAIKKDVKSHIFANAFFGRCVYRIPLALFNYCLYMMQNAKFSSIFDESLMSSILQDFYYDAFPDETQPTIEVTSNYNKKNEK